MQTEKKFRDAFNKEKKKEKRKQHKYMYTRKYKNASKRRIIATINIFTKIIIIIIVIAYMSVLT